MYAGCIGARLRHARQAKAELQYMAGAKMPDELASKRMFSLTSTLMHPVEVQEDGDEDDGDGDGDTLTSGSSSALAI